jgi:hypothetical protein
MTLVTSYTTVSILLAPAALGVALLARAKKTGRPRATSGNLVVLGTAAASLPAIWAARNYWVMGALSAQESYLRFARWTPLPFDQMLEHPIFTLDGAIFYWQELMAHYYRGEFTWHGEPMAYPWLDGFMVWSSLLFVVVALAAFLRRGRPGRGAIVTCFVLFAASVATLIGASIRYDFGDWLCPSRTYPYFAAGRLIFGTVVPFAMLYVAGLDVLLSRLRLARFRWIALAGLCFVLFQTELVLMTPALAAKCNLLHLLRCN